MAKYDSDALDQACEEIVGHTNWKYADTQDLENIIAERIIFAWDDPRWNYVRGAFPKTKGEAYECWHHISCGLAEESLWEDGELSLKERKRKEKEI